MLSYWSCKMSLLGYVLLLTAALCCSAAPAPGGKKCNRPDIKNGDMYYTYYFPINIGRSVEYRCDRDYVSHQRTYWGRIQCTDLGWNHEPKCSRQCIKHKSYVANAKLIDQQFVYLEGEKVKFECKSNFLTPDGKTDGERTCLPNGEFTPAKCSKTCEAPELPDGKFRPIKNIFDIGEMLHYECNAGFMAQNRKLSSSARCNDRGWSQVPRCIPVTCRHDGVSYNNGDVISYTCPLGRRPEFELGQCYYFGFHPPRKCPVPDGDLVTSPPDSKDKTEKRQKCPLPYNPIHAEIKDLKEEYYNNDSVTITCEQGYTMNGSPVIRCLEGKWEQPPECILLTPCRIKPRINNGDIAESSKRESYVTDDIVTFSCKPGYHLTGPEETTCVNGQWTTLPTCTENPCNAPREVLHATVVEKKELFNHGENAKYECENGFRFSGKDSAICIKGRWTSIPTCVATSCTSPPHVKNSRIDGQIKDTFASGEKVTYVCNPDFSLERSATGEALCEDADWKNVPVCRRIGAQCGPPPVVQYGDTISFTKLSYRSGESVEYKCSEYYVLQGNSRVRCLNGVWDEAPVCLEPCTAKEKEMQDNNIRLKFGRNIKFYSKHGDTMEFSCLSGYNAPPDTQMRITCELGKLEYPKCFKTGYCVLDQQTMMTHNIHYNVSTIVDNGETIAFQCNEETIPENKLEAKCVSGRIIYPKCSAASPCKISPEDLDLNNIQLLTSDNSGNDPDITHIHGTELTVTCRSGFRRPNEAALVIECNDGKFRYPRCFAGSTCRIDQDELDTNNLELDEVHDNEVFYEENERVHFTCKTGYYRKTKPIGKCSKEKVTYPSCTAESSR